MYKVIKNNQIVNSDVPGLYAGWRSGKIFGRLDCKSGLRMKKENRVFFLTYQDAIDSGYRPCKNCKPE
jgi:methylphosphotriester-DNA--protein-cysteine methyltransferase